MPSPRSPLQRLALAMPWRLAAGGLLLATLLLMRPTLSANLTVSTTVDTVDGDTSSVSALVSNPGADGKVSLREAITAANNTAGADTVTLPTGTYTLANGQLDVSDALTVVGNGPASSVVHGDNSNRLFAVGDVPLTLQALTLTAGSASSRGAAVQKGTASLSAVNVVFSANTSFNGGGGAVYSGGGTDTFTDCSFSNNNASGGGGALLKAAGSLNISGSSFANNRSSNTRGGAIDFTGSSLSLTNTSFSGNGTSSTNGGAVWAAVSGSASVTNNSFQNNYANNGNGGGLYAEGAGTWAISDTEFDSNSVGTAGGGLYVANSAAFSLTRVTFANNVATNGRGGGLHVAHTNTSTTTATNVTFHANQATASGGGGAAVSSGTLALLNATVVNNTVVNGAAALTHVGGTLTLKNTLVAANTGGNAQCAGTLTSQGYNLDSGNSCSFNATGDRVNATSGLGSFGSHGGSTRTVALTSTSAAINNGTATGAPGTDQRGYGRVGNTDIGAFEFNASSGQFIRGTVFEDRHYGGGAGRSLADSGGTGVAGARVELYDSNGAFVTATTSGSDGSYTLLSPSSGTWHVRVVGSTVVSNRSGYVAGLLPVLSYRSHAPDGTPTPVTDHVGGLNPGLGQDAPSATAGAVLDTSTGVFSAGLVGTAQQFSAVQVGTAAVSGIDFGFSFHTVSNTNDSGAGSLRQAILNANALGDDTALAVAGRTAGLEHLVFMLSNGTAAAGLRSSQNLFIGGVATIAPTSALPELTTPMVVNAQAQPGWTAAPIVELNGAAAGTNVNGLTARGGVTLRGLVINRFSGAGINLVDAGGHTVQGCYIGTNAAGTAARPNGTEGINVFNSPNNTLGGSGTSQGNLVSGNGINGITIVGNSPGNQVLGNTVGLDVTGTARIANGSLGLYINAASTVVGGATTSARNLVSGNTDENVQLGSAASGSSLLGNLLGTNASGNLGPVNGKDNLFVNGASNVNIGNNTIAGANGNGVLVAGDVSGVAMLGNRIFGNSALGIDLGGNGINTNDGLKTAGQPNRLMDTPVFTVASLNAGTLTVAGHVGSAAGQTAFANARVEIFFADGSGSHGQGRRYQGFLTTDASGKFSGSMAIVGDAANGVTRLTATATDSDGNTSEFGPNFLAGRSLSGTVFEDRHYGGGAGRSLATSGGSGVAGATVELYNASGTQVATTSTGTDGAYAFGSLGEGTYSVRVVDSTVRSNRSGSTGALRAVLSFRTDAATGTAVAVTDHVGGFHPAVADAAAQPNTVSLWTDCAADGGYCSFSGTQLVRYGNGARLSHRVLTGGSACNSSVFGDPAPGATKRCARYTTTVQSLATVQVGSSNVSGLDFGYSFHAVVNRNDSGQGSLRQAILNANALGDDSNQAQSGRSAGIDHLVFMLPNGSAAAGLRSHVPSAFTTPGGTAQVASIVLASGLPSISTAMAIDAQSQPGFGSRPLLELHGGAAGNSTGFALAAAGSMLRGFIVNRFNASGIELTASATVQGNWIGVDATGNQAAGNGSHGLNITGGTATVGGSASLQGNVISGNGGAGVWIGGGSAHVLQGNVVGLGADGSTRVGNTGLFGIEAYGSGGYTIGGSATGAGNTISGQSGSFKGGLWLCSPNNTALGNRIGTNAAGTAVVRNNGAGIVVCTGRTGNRVGGAVDGEGNLVAGNGSHGVVDAGVGTVIQGNRIGVNASGTAALANAGSGIALSGSSAVVGGLLAGAGNLVSGNTMDGLLLDGGGNHLVQGNFVGLNASGTAALPNGGQGLRVLNGSTGNLIGGATAAARNVISGNTLNGIWLTARGNVVQGNRIGTNAAGTAALPNGEDGVQINTVTGPSLSPATTVGGSNPGEGNLLSGNGGNGLRIESSDVRVWGNTIGLDASGAVAVANQAAGIRVLGSSQVSIGGTGSGQANNIGGNQGNGVEVDSGAGTAQGVRISGNRIWGNGRLGIDLMSPSNTRAVNSNDGTLEASQPNRGMDQPVFSSARARGSVLTVAGHVGSAPGQAAFAGALVEVFVHDGDASGHGEGWRYLGQVTADMNGNFSGSFTMPADAVAGLAIGTGLSGTATSPAGDTSEFGPQFSQVQVDLLVNSTADDADTNPGDGLCLTAAGRCTLRAALQEFNAWTTLAYTPTVAFELPGCSAAGQAACSIAPATVLPTVARALAIDGSSQPGWQASTGTPLVELSGAAAPANAIGLVVNANGFTLRGLVLNRWGSHGLSLGGSGHTVAGNWFGVNASGTAAAGNGGHGLHLTGSASRVGGTAAAERNVFSGNGLSGLALLGAGHTVVGNTAGLLPDGSTAAGNGQDGIYLAAASQRIGGAAAGEGNLLGSNGRNGARFDSGSDGSSALGNVVGLASDGSTPRGNADSGLGVVGSASDLTLGGPGAGQANTLAHNAGAGVGFESTAPRRVAISGNRMFSNGHLGIRLKNTNQVLANDGTTGGGSANLGLDHPVITGAGVNSQGNALTVYGHIGTGSGQTLFAGARVEVFRAAVDPSGFGEGEVYLGSLTADADGRFSGTLSFTAGTVAVGDRITATATSSAGDSSEFGPNWTSTRVEALAPAGFNAFDPGTAAGAIGGPIVSQTAGAATTLAIVALDSTGSGLHPSFSGSVQLLWLDARDNSGAASGSCRSSWVSLGSAGTASFSAGARVNVALTVPSTGTRDMRLQMVYSGPAGTVTACSGDNFAALPASLVLQASDQDAATAGTTRTLDNTAASGGVVHRAGRPFTLAVRALASGGSLMAHYDGTPSVALTGCLLPSGCSAGTLTGSLAAASAGVASAAYTYSEVGAVQLQASDISFGAVDAADTPLAARSVVSAHSAVGRFVPDHFTLALSTPGVLATGNASCLASGSAATFFDQGFGWATPPQATLTAHNAQGATTAGWTGALMKLNPATAATPGLAVAQAGAATLASSFGALALNDLGQGQVRLQADATDRFLLALASGTLQASLNPSFTWRLAVADTSEAAVAGNPASTAASLEQVGLGFDQGGAFHQGRLSLASSHGDARRGVRALVQLQRYTADGWVTMTEDRGCVSIAPANLGVDQPSGVFGSAGVCAAPLAAAATTRGGRAWLALPASPGGRSGRLRLRLAGQAASGQACAAPGSPQTLVPLGLPHLTGGDSGLGPAALATWGAAQRDTVLRRETW